MAFFKCQECGHQQSAPDREIGRSARCPKCKASSIILAKPEDWYSTKQQLRDVVPPKTKPIEPTDRPARWLITTVMIAYTLLGCAVVLGLLLFFVMLVAAESAIQQGAIGADFAALFVAGYVLVRCLEKATLLQSR